MYPAKHLLWYFRYALRRYDFEGFYGVILQKSLEESDLYTDWKQLGIDRCDEREELGGYDILDGGIILALYQLHVFAKSSIH